MLDAGGDAIDAPNSSLVALNRHKLEREQGNKSKQPRRGALTSPHLTSALLSFPSPAERSE